MNSEESGMGFHGKVVLITGASSGIGAATAVKFAKLGACLSLTGRNEVNLKQVAAKCAAESKSSPLTVVADLNKVEDVDRIMSETIAKYNKLDVLVNNAGIVELGTIETTSLDQFDRVFQVNVRSVFQLTKLAVPHLAKTKGNIVNVSSVNGLRSFAGVLAYNMSKSCLDQFTSCTALELAPKQIRVNSVNPGVIVTELQKRGGLDEAAYKAFLERSKETHALGRPGTADEVADGIAFLASDSASFITATHLSIDGGRHALCPR